MTQYAFCGRNELLAVHHAVHGFRILQFSNSGRQAEESRLAGSGVSHLRVKSNVPAARLPKSAGGGPPEPASLLSSASE